MTTDEQKAAAERSDAKRAAARQRPVMSAAELREHKVRDYGRDYSESDDGYGDMQAEQKRGWRQLSGWGRDGWDMGNWPYVAMMTRTSNDGTRGEDGKLARQYEVLTIVEGDRTWYRFDNVVDQEAALDYLFLWYAMSEDWAPKHWTREALDAGQLQVANKYRGWFSWERVEMTKGERAAEREARNAEVSR